MEAGVTTAFKCDLCEEVKLGQAAAFGGSRPYEAKVEAKRGQHTWQFTIFIFRAGPTMGTSLNYERDLHLCHNCTLDMLKEALAEGVRKEAGIA